MFWTKTAIPVTCPACDRTIELERANLGHAVVHYATALRIPPHADDRAAPLARLCDAGETELKLVAR